MTALDEYAWQGKAACKGTDTELFYPEVGASIAPAKAVCASCLVRNMCLDFALSHNEKFGVWGGTSERQRRRLRAEHRRLAA
jgi:WhiB family redox-sensing transcriptional regulator